MKHEGDIFEEDTDWQTSSAERAERSLSIFSDISDELAFLEVGHPGFSQRTMAIVRLLESGTADDPEREIARLESELEDYESGTPEQMEAKENVLSLLVRLREEFTAKTEV
ncbi:MAG: hypothetical protein V1898_00835 [Patescibacteria group bacterium]